MKHKKKWKPRGRPKTLTKTARGNRRQTEKIELRNMALREEDFVFGESFRLPAA